MIDKEALKIVRRVLDRAKNPNCTEYPTDNEVLLVRDIFRDLLDIGHTLGLEMLTAYACMHYNTYDLIAGARGLDK